MSMNPGQRQKNTTGQGKDVKRRGSGLGTGPVGNAGGYSGRPGTSGGGFSGRPSGGGFSGRPSGGGGTRSGGGGGLKLLILIALLVLGGGGYGVSSLFGGSSSSATPSYTQQPSYNTPAQSYTSAPSGGSYSYTSSNLMNMFANSSTSSGWELSKNTKQLDTTVASGSRDKYTSIMGNGRDNVTIMVYMCGTDLESRSGMASSDLQEMANATIGSNVNLIVYTGGCSGWRNKIVSSDYNQIYQVMSGGVKCLVNNDGRKSMTDPGTLASFIQFCEKNFPANRYDLIMWDHGGGSLSGYGYDEKFQASGSMTLPQLKKALSAADVKFDFIGFDACLMATLETALTMEPYADYLIASEETEPGIGWYYTNWLTSLSSNTSISTLDLGKQIVDDFVNTCDVKCRGQKTTLSVVDLAELKNTVPQKLTAFSDDTIELLKSDNYKQVSDARSAAREFATSSKIDQVDLVHLAARIGTDDSKALVNALLGAVKYNNTSSSITDAYGISIYFPYQKTSKVANAVSTYDAIDMDDDYARCIQQFASMELGGQAVSGGGNTPLTSLSGGSYGSAGTSVDVTSILGSLLGGNMFGISGMSGQNSSFLGSFLDANRDSSFFQDNMFDASALVWSNYSGTPAMYLPDDQWDKLQKLELNVFFDDGTGFIDLGLDSLYQFTDDGGLIGVYDGTWIAVDQQPVAFYYIDSVLVGNDYITTGRIPAMLNGSRVDLIVIFDNDHPYGYIAGARSDYRNGETETIAKAMTELQEGDTIDFLCDYYSYSGEYLDSYYLGDAMTYHEDMLISYVYIDESAANPVYRFTDMYNQHYWSPVMSIDN